MLSLPSRRLTAAAPDGSGARSRGPLALGAIVDSRVPRVSANSLGRHGDPYGRVGLGASSTGLPPALRVVP